MPHPSILDGLADMGRGNLRRLIKIGNGTGDLDDSGIGPRGQAQGINGLIEQASGWIIELTKCAQNGCAHLGVAMYGWNFPEPFFLNTPGLIHPFSYCGRALTWCGLFNVLDPHRRHLHLYIYPVQERPGKPVPVPLNLHLRAHTFLARIAIITAWAGVCHPLQKKLKRYNLK